MEILSNSSMSTFNNGKFVQSFDPSLNSVADSEYSFDAVVGIPENSETQNKKKRRRQRKNKNCYEIAWIDSPSAESNCSLGSMTTISSGICSSIGSSMQTLNEIVVEENNTKNSFPSSLISSTTASSIDCNESLLMEELDETFSECSFSCPKAITTSSQKQPKKKSKRKGKKPFQNSSRNPVIQQFFNQQKQFYLTIYEQQFSVLSSLKNSDENTPKKSFFPHQHLGLPPLPPPMGTSFDCYNSSMEEFLSSSGPCEQAYFNQIKQNQSISTLLIDNKSLLSSDSTSSSSVYSSNSFSLSSCASEESVELSRESISSNNCDDDDDLSKSILDLYENITQTERTLIRKLRLRDLLYYSIVQTFPVCGLYVVGSSLNGFGNESSDMDLCLVITNGELDQRTAAVDVLLHVEKLLATLPAIKEQTLIRAKVPILRIKFRGPFSDMIVDLNANNSVAVRNTHLLCYYAFFDWRVRPLVTVVKEWAKQKDINDSTRSTFTSYSLVLMVLHFLQVLDNPVLPSLQQYFPKRFHPKADIRTLNLAHPLDEIPVDSDFKRSNTSSLATLLIAFFHYYAFEYDYEKNAISIRLGHEVERSEVVRGIRHWSPICIEEPFNHANVAHSVYDEMIFKSIKQKFRDAHELLSKTLDLSQLLTIKPARIVTRMHYEQTSFITRVLENYPRA